MSVRAWLLALAVLLAGTELAHGQTKDKAPVAYRWVDEKGVVHFGDRIPSQDSQKEHTVLNREGVEVGRSDAQKSPAQIAEEARREQERLLSLIHISEPTRLGMISYAVFCLKKKK